NGSVVLQAQNTQFRVHFSILSLHSTFFRDMQGLPQPHDQLEPTVEGCPLIVVHDSVEDVEYLLKALYNPGLFDEAAIPFPYIASFVRLGRKYEFRNLFNIAVGRLAFENPATLKKYDALMDTLELAAGKRVPHSTTRIVNYPGIRQDTLTLVRENGLLALLPCAYYRVLSYSIDEIFSGISRPDGTTSRLSSIDLRTCAVGLERVLAMQFMPDSPLGWIILWKPTDDCKSVSTCQSWRDTFISSILISGPKVYSLSVLTLENTQLCVSCKEPAGRAAIAGRAKFWEDLPSFFDLPPWSELRNDI
ncbi:hypothetical protein C8F04DRAFT_949202, partial [Mycena alexandri]